MHVSFPTTFYAITIDYINKDSVTYKVFYEPFIFDTIAEVKEYAKYLKRFFEDYNYVEEKENVYKNPETNEIRHVQINIMTRKKNMYINDELKDNEEETKDESNN